MGTGRHCAPAAVVFVALAHQVAELVLEDVLGRAAFELERVAERLREGVHRRRRGEGPR